MNCLSLLSPSVVVMEEEEEASWVRRLSLGSLVPLLLERVVVQQQKQ
jgi:hypothetical protein